MKRFLVVLLALALSCTPVIGATSDPATFVIGYENPKGLVTFNHESHATQYECSICHEGEVKTIIVDKDFGHKTCKSCHKDVGNDAPVRCNECHVK